MRFTALTPACVPTSNNAASAMSCHRLRPTRGRQRWPHPRTRRRPRRPDPDHRVAAAQLRTGAKGPRDYLWAWITTTRPGEHRWLLIRRNRTTSELAFYLCWSPRPAPLHTLVTVAGSRWSFEELFQTAKGQIRLDHYQIRSWTGWHRFITLAVLTIRAATAPQPDADQKIIALTVAEIRRLLNALILATSLPQNPHPALVNLATNIPSPTVPLPAQTRPTHQPKDHVTLEY